MNIKNIEQILKDNKIYFEYAIEQNIGTPEEDSLILIKQNEKTRWVIGHDASFLSSFRKWRIVTGLFTDERLDPNSEVVGWINLEDISNPENLKKYIKKLQELKNEQDL